MGLQIHLFWTSGDVSSRFKSQSLQPYLHLEEAYIFTCSLRFTCGATAANLVVTRLERQTSYFIGE